VGGLVGSLLAGFASDWLSGGRRGPAVFWFSLAGAAFVPSFGALSAHPQLAPPGWLLGSAAVFLLGLLADAPRALIGLFAMESVDARVVGSASGAMTVLAQLGAATAGLPVGLLVQHAGWSAYFAVLSGAAVVSTVLFAFAASREAPPKEVKEKGR